VGGTATITSGRHGTTRPTRIEKSKRLADKQCIVRKRTTAISSAKKVAHTFHLVNNDMVYYVRQKEQKGAAAKLRFALYGHLGVRPPRIER
jgi:hypothetical protein